MSSQKYNSGITLSYRVVGIEEPQPFPGYVAVYLEPIQKIKQPVKRPKVQMDAVGPKGCTIPKQVLQQMQFEVEGMMQQVMKNSEQSEDPRNIIHLEPIVDFVSRNWRYGDIVEVNINKVKDVSERDPVEIEQSDHQE